MTRISTTTHLWVNDSEPRAHCEHPGGRPGINEWSVEISTGTNTAYLIGTPDQLLAWARKVSVVALNLLDRYDQQWVDKSEDPPRVLSFDECERLGLDGTGRT